MIGANSSSVSSTSVPRRLPEYFQFACALARPRRQPPQPFTIRTCSSASLGFQAQGDRALSTRDVRTHAGRVHLQSVHAWARAHA
eukprot:4045352-Pleurochrysis_carterae.AAC.2